MLLFVQINTVLSSLACDSPHLDALEVPRRGRSSEANSPHLLFMYFGCWQAPIAALIQSDPGPIPGRSQWIIFELDGQSQVTWWCSRCQPAHHWTENPQRILGGSSRDGWLFRLLTSSDCRFTPIRSRPSQWIIFELQTGPSLGRESSENPWSRDGYLGADRLQVVNRLISGLKCAGRVKEKQGQLWSQSHGEWLPLFNSV